MPNSLRNRRTEYYINYTVQRGGVGTVYSKGDAYLIVLVSTGAATIDFFSFMFCIPISDHVMVPKRTAFFKCYSMHVHPHA